MTTQSRSALGELSAPAVAALIASMMVVGLSFGATAPLVASLLEARGYSEYFTGSVAAMLALAIALLSGTAGRLVYRHGSLRVNLIGLGGQATAFGALGLALWLAPVLLLGVRFALGAAAAASFVAVEVALLRGVRDGIRGRVMAVYGTALNGGVAGGMLLANAAYTLMGLWCFAGIGALALSVMPLAAWGLRELPALEDDPNGDGSAPRAAVMPILLALHGAIIFAVIDTAMSGAYPVEGQRLGLTRAQALQICGILFAGTLVAQPICGWLADRLGAVRVLAGAALAGIAAAIAAGIVSRTTAGFPGIAMSFFAVGIAGGAAYPISLKLIAERVSATELPSANARFGAAYGYGSLFGPLIAAFGIDVVQHLDRLGWALPGLCASVFAMVLPLAVLDLMRARQPAPVPD